MPRGAGDPALSADDLRDYFEVEGDFRLVQRPSRWAGEALLRTLLWLRQVFRDPALERRRPPLFAHPGDAGDGPALAAALSRPTITGPGPTICRRSRPLVRRTARDPNCLGLILHSDYAARRLSPGRRRDPAKILVAHNGAEPGRIGAPMARRLRTRRARACRRTASIAALCGADQRAEGARPAARACRAPARHAVPAGRLGGRGADRGRGRARSPTSGSSPGRRRRRCPPGWHAADVLLIPPSRAPLEQFAIACCR